MIHNRKEMQEVEIPESVQCNACGRRWRTDWHGAQEEALQAQEVERFEVNGGYGNEQWGDLVRLVWHACPDCVAAWLRTFKIEPEAFELSLAVGGRPQPIPFELPVR